MQVDPTLMNVGDGGTVSRDFCASKKASSSMVGNPPQTLPPEFRGDVNFSQQNKNTPTRDCKTVQACLDSCNCNHKPALIPLPQPNNAPMPNSVLTSSEKRNEVPEVRADSAGVFPTPQWPSGVKATREDSLNPSHGNVTSSKKSHPHTQPLHTVPPRFQCSAMFKPAQPVAFLPTNFSAPLCKITIPPALGPITALREATASQPQSPGVGGAPLIRAFPCSLPVGQTPEKKGGTSTLKLKSNHASSTNTNSLEEHKSLASVVASPTIALPLQHPSLTSTAPTHFTLSPTAAICCGPALASITSQSRILNHVEQGNSMEKTAMGCLKTAPSTATGEHTADSVEQRDVPLDLSAKSKRPKSISDAPAMTESHINETNQRDLLNAKITHSTTFSSAAQYPILPNTHRNGSHPKQTSRTQNHQVPESKPTWNKGSSQDSIKTIPGTYVGVASPILASTLRGKDGKGTFADEFQSFAKQELISIIDQGEPQASGVKKPPCVNKGNQNTHSVKHIKNASTAITRNCPPKGALTSALLSSTNSQSHQKSASGNTSMPYSSSAVNLVWQKPAHLPQQPSAVQRKISQGVPKTKGSTSTEGCTFQTSHHNPSKSEDEKWDRRKSPLSNLASIVKQQTLETVAPTAECNAQISPVATKKVDVPDPVIGSQETQSKHAPAFEYPSYWPVDKWPSGPSQGELTKVMKRHEKVKPPDTLENDITMHTSQHEHMGSQAKQTYKSPDQSQVFGSNASTNGNRMESKLAQVLEGEVSKKENMTFNSEKREGLVASIFSRQCAGEGDKPEKKADGTKEESPTKLRTAATKQKKTSLKLLAKEKSPTDQLKKLLKKKKQQTADSPIKVAQNKKKKQCLNALEPNLLAEKVSPQLKRATPKDQISSDAEQPISDKTGTDSRRRISSEVASVSPRKCVSSSKEVDATESIPRLRRGRRRADDARLDLWGFATPSPPPPPMPAPAASPPLSSTLTPTQPTRRPRGRPRSITLTDHALQGKSKTGDAAGDTPPHKKRRRYSSKKYETGDYITERDKLEDGDHLGNSVKHSTGNTTDAQADECLSLTDCSNDSPPKRSSLTHSGSVHYPESEDSPQCNDKPSGKRKFKSKHLCDGEEQKNKTKRSSLGKRGAPLATDDDGDDTALSRSHSSIATPKKSPASPHHKKGVSGRSSSSESPPKRPVPPEVRRLIVNKNAGETLLQRAARLGYQDVVQYCIEKDIREVNRRDNAGYTALHEASSRGWTQIVEILLKHGADVNCSSQDGTRPLHDAVASDNLPIVWLLLNHGADPTLATYSGYTSVKLAHSPSMKTFLTEYFVDLEGRKEQDSNIAWDFYSSSLFETEEEPCWDFLLSEKNQEQEENGSRRSEPDSDKDCLLFEFSSEPLLPCYHVQVSLSQGFCNWFLLTDVLKRLKMSARIFRARYPHFEVVSLSQAEFWKQVSVSQVSSALASPYKGKHKEEEENEENDELVDLVRCVPELQRLLGSSIDIVEDNEDEEEMPTNASKPRS